MSPIDHPTKEANTMTTHAPKDRRSILGSGARLVVALASVAVLGLVSAAPSGADVSAPTGPTIPAAATTTSTTPTDSPATTTAASAAPGTTGGTSGSRGNHPAGTGGTHPGAITPKAGVQLDGDGSSFAAPAIENFASSVQPAPYGLDVNYSSTSSGDGRFEFANQTTDFAVSDIGYGLGSTDTSPPSFSFIYVPITAGGIAFMYNIPGLTKPLQLSSYTACGILTGGITNWDSSAVAADNPGVTMPNLAIRPVTESDSAGTNFVLEEWCIDEQPALWAAFANQ